MISFLLQEFAAWYNRGIALEILERNEEAILSYDQAIEIKPDDPDAWHNSVSI